MELGQPSQRSVLASNLVMLPTGLGLEQHGSQRAVCRDGTRAVIMTTALKIKHIVWN